MGQNGIIGEARNNENGIKGEVENYEREWDYENGELWVMMGFSKKQGTMGNNGIMGEN